MLIEIIEIFICLFAVYGIYAIICRILARLMRKDSFSIALHVEKEELSAFTVGDSVRAAEILSESMNGRLLPPVMLLSSRPTDEELSALRELGLELYIKKK